MSAYLQDGDDAYATDVVVKRNNVYIAGVKSSKAGYWKNNVFTPLTDQFSFTVSIAVYGDDVLVAGNIVDSSQHRYGILWKNGVPVPLFDGTDPSIELFGALPAKR